MPLPPALKQRIGALPQWCAIGLPHSYQAVSIRMHGSLGEIDVTRTAVVAALQPLTLAIGLDENARGALGAYSAPILHFVDIELQRAVGTLHLVRIRESSTRAAPITLFEVADGAQQCLDWPYRSWNRYLQNRAIRRHRRPGNFWLSPDAVQQLMIFYICPRQVVLVSVQESEHRNLFPMDLIGPVAADRFTLALRNTSQSVPAIKAARRVVLSDVAATDCGLAYRLGVHHRDPLPDWRSLPCPVARSQEFSLPFPQSALRVRELEILDYETIGSHTLFVGHVAAEQPLGDGDQLHQTSGFYQHFRTRHGRPFRTAD
jgi:flavin reductase (DIM6/NTAB) family NADH-FMN oxidoreductase RutF